MFDKILKIFRLFNQAFRAFRKQIILLIFLGIVSGFMEGIGVNTIIPLFSLLANNEMGKDLYTRTLISVFNFFHIPFNLVYLLILICGTSFHKGFLLLPLFSIIRSI